MKSIAEMSQIEVAAYVYTHLAKKGIKVVLSGGAAVAFYSHNKYVSKDLDFVNMFFAKREKIRNTMAEIGFKELDRHFKHPDSDFFVEFPPGPLSLGNEPVRDISTIQLPTGELRLLSPTDCVKDRLAAYYHWGDLQGLYQAELIAEVNKIDLDEIERWSEKEGMREKFLEIKARLV